MRAVIHVDMDAFFAAVEERKDPDLEGRSVVVGADPQGGDGRGVVSTCNYKARRYGISSGMPIAEAYERCPDAFYLPVDRASYSTVSERLMDRLRRSGDRFEKASIDEAYISMQDTDEGFDTAVSTAKELKKDIHDDHGLSCSVGVARNETVAKIASDRDKPDGFTVVRPGTERGFLSDMDVGAIPGVGDRTEERLAARDITTVGDLASCPGKELRDVLGKHGVSIHRKARGIDPSPVGTRSERKSIGSETTFRENVEGIWGVKNFLQVLCNEVGKEVRERGVRFRTVELKLRRSDFETFTRQKTVGSPLRSVSAMYDIAERLLDRFDEEESYRLVGVRVKNLRHGGLRQARLSEFVH